MKFFNNLNIASKLLVAFALLLLLTTALGVFAIGRIGTVHSATEKIKDRSLPSVKSILEMKAIAWRYREGEVARILTTDASKVARAEAQMAQCLKDFSVQLNVFKELVSTPEDKADFQAMMAIAGKYIEKSQKILALSQQGNQAAVRDWVDGESQTLFSESMEKIETLAKRSLDASTRAGQSAEATYQSARMWITGVLIATVVVGILMAFALAQLVSRPLLKAVGIANTVASGNLSKHIEVTSRDETGQLMQALKFMNDSLVKVAGEVRSRTDTITTASEEIAAGNLDLSYRTEKQAVSLEETAASMEQLTATAKQTADNARQANGLANSASTAAVMGSAVVSQVVQTMASINESSKKIADITGVIDGIAFQTNILALNAAVEAARAGEQGRGFAVVASEVRNLAQRSAVAAKDIKHLITDSVCKVDSGTRLVDQAGATMEEIVACVKRVTDIMAEISAASLEQSVGIEHVNAALSQMDLATQQNAALVEEAAAASESMQAQAVKLAQAVSVFKLPGTSPTVRVTDIDMPKPTGRLFNTSRAV